MTTFRIEFDRRQVTCPRGQVSNGWHGPPPDILADRGPADRGPFHHEPVPPLPGPGHVHHLPRLRAHRGLSPRELLEPQPRNRAERQEPAWHTRYAVRSGIEGTICEFAHGHGLRRGRYRGQAKTHPQHVLTAITVNIEHLSRRPPDENAPPRPPTAFQDYLDQQDIPRQRSWRAVS